MQPRWIYNFDDLCSFIRDLEDEVKDKDEEIEELKRQIEVLMDRNDELKH